MPLYPEKEEQNLVQFLWDSPNNGIVFINKIVWNAQADPIRIFGKFIGHQGLGDLYLEVFSKHIDLAKFIFSFVRL